MPYVELDPRERLKYLDNVRPPQEVFWKDDKDHDHSRALTSKEVSLWREQVDTVRDALKSYR